MLETISTTPTTRPFLNSTEHEAADPVVAQAAEAAKKIVAKNISAKGLAASIDNYPQVWTRDSVITFLGGSIDREPSHLDAFRVSLETLSSRQDRFGQIPFLVQIATDATRYRSADSNPWYVIGACYYAKWSGNSEWLREQVPQIVLALDWCESRDFDKAGLMESGECDDWADLLCNRGNVLFPNVLYFAALNVAAEALRPWSPADADRFAARASVVGAAIQRQFWVAPLDSYEDRTHERVRTQISLTLRKRPFFLPWVNLFEFGERFDTTANLLAILAGVATPAQAGEILDFIEQTGLNQPSPVQVLYPAILPGEKDWRDYHKVWGNNLPYQYHNGGIWPWVGGVYVAALVKAGRAAAARTQLVNLARSLRLGSEPWECNEWLHGQTGQPMGAKFQAWSAGMFLYAKHAVETGETPGFFGSSANSVLIPPLI